MDCHELPRTNSVHKLISYKNKDLEKLKTKITKERGQIK